MEGGDEECPVFRTDMRYLVAYDVVVDRQRTKVAHLLEEYGDRIQKSVFECFLNERSKQELWEEMVELINVEEDRVRMYPLCRACERKVEIAGGGPVRVDEVEVYIV